MTQALFHLQYLLAAAALWLNRLQQLVIDYLMDENRLLNAKLGDRKFQFTELTIRRVRLGGMFKDYARKAA